MMSDLSIKSPATFMVLCVHLASCCLEPKLMNSVFEGFILSLVWSIHDLILIMQLSNSGMVLCSNHLSPALKDLCMLWSSTKPLSCKFGGITSLRGEQYRLKMFAPAQLPWGMLTSKSLSEL